LVRYPTKGTPNKQVESSDDQAEDILADSALAFSCPPVTVGSSWRSGYTRPQLCPIWFPDLDGPEGAISSASV